MVKGRILLLNGTSSAGKTTLSWELQTHAPGYWYWLALDSFLDAVPSQLWDKDQDKGYMTAIDMHSNCVKLIADQGKDVIVDTVLCGDEAYKSFVQRLAGYKVIMVKVTCPVDELERRERNRGDRDIGTAVNQIDRITPKDGYDLVVDTHAQSTEECAQMVIKLLTKGAEST